MLIDFQVNNFKVFQNKIYFTMIGNKKITNTDNVWKFKDYDIVKSSIIYGPNNTGKSTFIEAVEVLKNIINMGNVSEYTKEYSEDIIYNFFNDKKEISFCIKFIVNNDIYEYYLEFELNKKITNEMLKVNNITIFDSKVIPDDEEIAVVLKIQKSYPEKLIVTMLPESNKKYSDEVKNFFDKISILRNGYNMDEVYNLVSKYTDEDRKKLNKIIKDADISIDKMEIEDFKTNDDKYNIFKLVSIYKMNNKIKVMPSVISDSKGTKMFIYYIIKILELKKNGGILFIDEIDSSLHTLLVKEILNLFNNEENKNMQLVVTSHDLFLLDCKYMFRKDQVWFTYKDNTGNYFYSLDEFKNHENNSIRNDTLKEYLKGMFGALPQIDIEKGFYDIE